MYNIVSLSGGKDSTYMLHEMICRGVHIDEVVRCDTYDSRQNARFRKDYTLLQLQERFNKLSSCRDMMLEFK